MHVYRDSPSIRQAAETSTDPELRRLISVRIEELSEYEDCDLGELINIIVIEPGDTLTDLDQALGFTLADRPIDIVESHLGWYELTLVISNDGFGFVLFFSKQGIEAALLSLCKAKEPSP